MMPATHENILDNGNWDEIKPSWQPATQRRPSAKTFVNLVRPSFLTKKTTSANGKQAMMKTRRTAYLDGVRGFAAFMVYLGHHQLWGHDSTIAEPILENAFGYNRQFYFACLPFIRTFFSGGHYAVSVFFVLSGYVLSAKPLVLINDGDYVKLGDNMSSALFRRWLRLFIPVIGTTFVYITIWHVFGIHAMPDPQGNYRDEVWNWYAEFKNFSFIFRMGGEPWFSYNFHSWSIPVEFKGSIVVYTTLMAFSRCTRNARLWCEFGLIVYFMWIADGWFCALFMAGVLISDLELLALDNNLPRFLYKIEPYKTTVSYILLCCSIYLGGVPAQNRDVTNLRNSPGWYYLSFLKPQAVFDYKWFYLFWAAIFLVVSIPRLPWLKAFFETRFNQYLGRISFGFYLIHGPVLWTLGDRIYAATGWTREAHAVICPGWINKFPLPKVGPYGLELGYLLPHLILLPLTLWLAEITTKVFDEPSVRFAQWAYAKTQPSRDTIKA